MRPARKISARPLFRHVTWCWVACGGVLWWPRMAPHSVTIPPNGLDVSDRLNTSWSEKIKIEKKRKAMVSGESQKKEGLFVFGFNATRAAKKVCFYLLTSRYGFYRLPELTATANESANCCLGFWSARKSVLNVSAINETMVGMATHSCPYWETLHQPWFSPFWPLVLRYPSYTCERASQLLWVTE